MDKQAPEPDEDLVVFRTFNSHVEAEIARSLLEAFGIECLIRSDDWGGQGPLIASGTGIQLIVRAEDEERAAEVVSSPESEG